MPTIYATDNPIILSYSLCYSITVFANDLRYCPFYNFIMLCCPLYFITAATFRHQFFPPKLPHWDFQPYSPFHHHGEGGGGTMWPYFQRKQPPGMAREGGRVGYASGAEHLWYWKDLLPSQGLKWGGGGGEAGTLRFKLTSTSVDKGLHPRVGMGSGGGGPW